MSPFPIYFIKVTAKWECAQASPEDGRCAAGTAARLAACAERVVAQAMRGFEPAAADPNPPPSRLPPPPNLAMAGEYTDPNHAAGYRAVQVWRGGALTVEGSDSGPKAQGKEWALKGRAAGNNAVVDFSPKGGPKDLAATFDGAGLNFPDGNRWSKVH